MQVRKRLKLQVGEYDWQSLMGFIRLFVFGLGVIIAFGWFGSIRLDGVDVRDIADRYREAIFYFRHLPQPILLLIASIFNGSSFRYMIAPFSAIVCVLIAGAYYVKDVYALPTFGDGMRYVLASMFGMNYPTLVIDRGAPQIKKNETNLIDKIGGPGFVVIEPGNAAMFRKLRGPTEAKVSEVHFLAPFEVLAQAVNLDDQHGYKEEVNCMTRDGIKVLIKDINFRYRIKPETEGSGKPARRTLENPYPFSEKAILDMTFGLVVEKSGVENWRKAVDRMVVGFITDFVADKSIDFLTAPRDNPALPRQDMQAELFSPAAKKAFANVGVEFLWIDVGHIEIEDESIDDLRTTLWSAEWAGDANVARAYGDAVRQAYQELGRAEAQADLIMSIAGSLSEAEVRGESRENIRKLLIARTAQILDAMGMNPRNDRQENGPEA
jgi:hypothetical protein